MIKYPSGNKSKSYVPQQQSYGKRGMSLEHELNETNDYYLQLDRAVIFKKPTPVQIVNVDYPNRASAKIVEAYFKTPSTTDYNGVYRGRAIDFEAKECSSKTSFPLSSIHSHQLLHLKRVCHHGAIGFVIIRFTKLGETFLVDALALLQQANGPKKSIPYLWFKDNAWLIPNTLYPSVDYLKIIDKIYFQEEL